MVFNILQFHSEVAELEYWKNLAHERGEALEELKEENKDLLSSVSAVERRYNDAKESLSEVLRTSDTLKENLNRMEGRLENLQTRMDQIEIKKNTEYRDIHKKINKLQKDVIMLERSVKSREKKPWK
ncbi:uncharacterized protein [Fopius arisanus]|uniref:CTTNBP2_1 protein n=1 Tax=Fopius arisanus TaxID=64838 RepID=A0A0C9QCI4_9HYME|nr:PREDICTED: uncharacterized protein LOC105269665 [Fopius arisanus]